MSGELPTTGPASYDGMRPRRRIRRRRWHQAEEEGGKVHASDCRRARRTALRGDPLPMSRCVRLLFKEGLAFGSESLLVDAVDAPRGEFADRAVLRVPIL